MDLLSVILPAAAKLPTYCRANVDKVWSRLFIFELMANWIGIKTASNLTQKPERTLRYYAAQGKIGGKKEGQNWLIDLESLQAAGFVKVSIVPPPRHFAQ